MAEILSHVLFAFALFTAIGWVIDWFDQRWVVAAMVGSVIPDLNRVELIINSGWIESTLGIPFSWGAIHTIGGVLLLSAIGAAMFATREHQRKGFVMLVAGGSLHLLLDAVKVWADGYNGAYLYPFSWWRNPTPGWYVSADRWVVVVAIAVALVVFVVDRYVYRSED